jgi:glycosyltransferase involved in cell wall biosynthesis
MRDRPMTAPSKIRDGALISVVVPIFMEQDNIRPLLARLEPVLGKIGTYEIIFSLDPCRDRTEHVVREEIAPRTGLWCSPAASANLRPRWRAFSTAADDGAW